MFEQPRLQNNLAEIEIRPGEDFEQLRGQVIDTLFGMFRPAFSLNSGGCPAVRWKKSHMMRFTADQSPLCKRT